MMQHHDVQSLALRRSSDAQLVSAFSAPPRNSTAAFFCSNRWLEPGSSNTAPSRNAQPAVPAPSRRSTHNPHPPASFDTGASVLDVTGTIFAGTTFYATRCSSYKPRIQLGFGHRAAPMQTGKGHTPREQSTPDDRNIFLATDHRTGGMRTPHRLRAVPAGPRRARAYYARRGQSPYSRGSTKHFCRLLSMAGRR
jgi:hypothetical protein